MTLEQVEQLDKRVHQVVKLVESLRHDNERLYRENTNLVEENQRLRTHLQELKQHSLSLAGNQDLLEKGLVGAIDRLETLAAPTNNSDNSGFQSSIDVGSKFPVLPTDQEEDIDSHFLKNKEHSDVFHEIDTPFVGGSVNISSNQVQQEYDSSTSMYRKSSQKNVGAREMEIF